MPIRLITTQSVKVVQGNRGRHFDQAVRTLAPTIAALRSAGILAVGQLAECLNDKGVLGPSGGPFTYGAMHRILKRLVPRANQGETAATIRMRMRRIGMARPNDQQPIELRGGKVVDLCRVISRCVSGRELGRPDETHKKQLGLRCNWDMLMVG
jgi:hypothetical protein